MIKCDNAGVVEIRGRKFELMAEFTVIIRELKNMRVLTDDDIKECLEQASKSDEELSKEINDMIEELFDSIL